MIQQYSNTIHFKADVMRGKTSTHSFLRSKYNRSYYLNNFRYCNVRKNSKLFHMSFLFLKILDLLARHGYFWSLYSLNMNADLFFWEIMNGMVFKPLPVTMAKLRYLLSEASHYISKEMVRKAVVCLRTRAARLVNMDGREKDLTNFSNYDIIQLVP